jgi:hypothetical protein
LVSLQRPFPLKGRSYANVFIHFEPVELKNGEPLVNKLDATLPPYVLADSLEGERQREANPDGQEYVSFLRVFKSIRLFVANSLTAACE